VTLTFELDLDSIQMSWNARYHIERTDAGLLSRSKIITLDLEFIVQIHTKIRTHTGPIVLLRPLKWSVKIFKKR